MTHYDMWFHEALGAYAVRVQFGQVTGVCGPLPLTTAADRDPAAFEYDGREATLQRFREHPKQFCLLEAWWGGQRVAPTLDRPRPGWWARAKVLAPLLWAPLAVFAAALDGATMGSEEDQP